MGLMQAGSARNRVGEKRERERKGPKEGETRERRARERILDEKYREFLYVVLAVLLSPSGRLDAGSRRVSKCNESQGVAQD